MASFKIQNGCSPTKPAQYTKVPLNTPTIKSHINTQKTTFVWDINGVGNIQKLHLWNVTNCNFDAGPFKWHMSLSLSPNKNSLFVKPSLVSSGDVSTSYYVRVFVLNQQNFVIHGPQYAPDYPVYIRGSEGLANQDDPNKWEVLRFSDGIIDQFFNYVFHDTLRLLVEFTVFVSEQQ